VQAPRAKLLLIDVLRFQNTVGGKQNDIAGFKIDSRLLVFGIGQEAQRHAFAARGRRLDLRDELFLVELVVRELCRRAHRFAAQCAVDER